MANININYKGLTGIIGSVTIDEADTLDNLILAISVDEGLDSNYYTISKLNNPTANSLLYTDSSFLLSDTELLIGNNDTIICTTNQVGSKEARQIQKLDIAQRKRTGVLDSTQAPYYRPLNTYDRDLLPTKYTGNAITDNVNTGGLVVGRPWTIALGDAAGLFKTTYTGYFEDNVDFFATATPATFGANPATSVQTTEIFEPNSEDGELFSVQWLGYFKPTTTETHTFFLNSDDGSYMWIGATAVTGFTIGNALINNGGAHAPVEVSGSIALTAGQYYPVRIQYGEGGGGDELQFNYETPTIAKTTNVTGLIFYNTATNGF